MSDNAVQKAMGRRLLLASITVVVFTACGGTASTPSASQFESPPASPSESPSPSPSPGLTVSGAALCIEMVDHLGTAAELVFDFADDAQAFGDSGGARKIEGVLEDLRHDRSVAPADFHASLDVQIGLLEEIVDYLGTGGERDWNFRDFRSTGFDLAVKCEEAGQ